MEAPGFSIFMASRLVEIIGLVRSGYVFSPVAFKFVSVTVWISTIMVIVGTSKYIMEAEEFDTKTLRAVAILICGIDALSLHVLICRKRKTVGILIEKFKHMRTELIKDKNSWETFEEADRLGLFFVKAICCILFNIPFIAVHTAIVQYTTGETHYPIEMATFGFPTPVIWVSQILAVTVTLSSWLFYHCILKICVYHISAYSTILSRMLRERPVEDNPLNDKKIMEFYRDIGRLVQQLNNIFGEGGLTEVVTTSLRCAFVCIQLIENIKKEDYVNSLIIFVSMTSAMGLCFSICSSGQLLSEQNETIRMGIVESEWHNNSPKSRKALIPLLIFTKEPFTLHFKRYMTFDMKMFRRVYESTFSFITFLSNFM